MDIRERYEAQKKDRERGAQERGSQPWWWLGQRDPIVRLTKWLVVWTALLFVGTLISAGILWETDDTQRESFTAVQRPFIIPLELKITPTTDIRKKIVQWFFQPSIKNSGNTPTKDLMFYSTFAEAPRTPVANAGEAFQGVQMPDVPWTDPDNAIDRGFGRRSFLGPQVTAPIGGIGIPISHIQEMASGALRGYVSGSIRYKDRFRKTEPHVTKFCFQIGVSRNDKGLLIPSYGLCQHWNCVDEECEDDKKRYREELTEAYRKVGKEPDPVFMQ